MDETNEWGNKILTGKNEAGSKISSMATDTMEHKKDKVCWLTLTKQILS